VLLARCFGTWLALREFPGVFSLPDACKQLLHVLQPGRLTERSLLRFIRNELIVRSLPDGVHEVRIRRNGYSSTGEVISLAASPAACYRS